MEIIGIAGGSGAGKSTVTYNLVDSDPDRFEVLNLDDYQKVDVPDAELPIVGNMINWDHPDVIDWERLRRDIKTLRSDQLVTIHTWSHRSNTDYSVNKRLRPRIVYPRPVLIVEGYLALRPEIADVYDHSFYLELDDRQRIERRLAARLHKELPLVDKYIDQVLLPMHRQFIEPTRKLAHYVIDVSNRTPDDIANIIRTQL